MLVLDREYYQYHKETQLGLMSFMCQAGGYFTKKASGRPVSKNQERMYPEKRNEKLLRKLMQYQEEGCRINDFVLQYVTHAEFPAVAIGGFRTEEQLLEGLDGVESRLPEEALRELAELKEKQRVSQEAAT